MARWLYNARNHDELRRMTKGPFILALISMTGVPSLWATPRYAAQGGEPRAAEIEIGEFCESICKYYRTPDLTRSRESQTDAESRFFRTYELVSDKDTPYCPAYQCLLRHFPRADVDRLMETGKYEFYVKGDFDRAKMLFARVVDQSQRVRQRALAVLYLARCEQAEGNLTQAKRLLKDLHVRYPQLVVGKRDVETVPPAFGIGASPEIKCGCESVEVLK